MLRDTAKPRRRRFRKRPSSRASLLMLVEAGWRAIVRHPIAGCLITLILLAPPAMADTLRVMGAGSLSEAFTDLLRRFPAGVDTIAVPEFGPSGLMREKIETGLDV